MDDTTNNVTGNINPMDIYAAARLPTDPNLVELVAMNLKELVSDTDADIFINSYDITMVFDANPIVQRITINRYLSNTLLVYRSMTGVAVVGILPFITTDGYIEDWMSLLKEVIFPFMKANNVLSTVTNSVS